MIVRLLPFLGLFVLGACSTAVRSIPEDPHIAWQQRQHSLQQLQSWELQARIAVKSGDQGGQANLHWFRKKFSQDMRLVGPWGKGLVRLQFDRKSARLTDDRGEQFSGTDASELLFQATGWIVPVENLRSWVAGVPVSDRAETQLDKFGRVAVLNESGWQVQYQEYHRFGRWELPRKLILSQVKAVNGEQLISVRLVVNAWQVDS